MLSFLLFVKRKENLNEKKFVFLRVFIHKFSIYFFTSVL